MAYAQDQAERLICELGAVRQKGEALAEAFLVRSFTDAAAKEYALHGFVRRVYTLLRSVSRVFEVLPLDITTMPEPDAVLDATINVQAFMFNTFGCLDNLAWTWIREKGVRSQKGRVLGPHQIGLGPGAPDVRASFSLGFRTYLESFDPWFRHLEDFRHALAHRIPLYIPPHTIPRDREADFNALEAAAAVASTTGDLPTYFKLRSEQCRLGVFQPMFLHSLNQNSSIIWLHPQLLTDFNTVEDIGRKFLEELDR